MDRQTDRQRETLSNCTGDDVTCYQLYSLDKGFAATTTERVSLGERESLSSRYRLICTDGQTESEEHSLDPFDRKIIRWNGW